MKDRCRGKAIAFLVATSALVSPVPPAAAAPVAVQEDRTDNHLRFTYDGESGTLESQSSFRRADEGAVLFEVTMSEADGYGSGLVGKLRLRLEGDRAQIYEGWFSLTVTDDEGDASYTRTVPDTVHLKPRPGERKATLAFRFDLPSGTYEAIGDFNAD